MKELSSISTYYLLLELMDDGNIGLLPELEPLTEVEIVSELESRTSENYGSKKDDWAQWFLGAAEYGSEMERANFFLFLDARKTMQRAANSRPAKLKDHKDRFKREVTRVEVISQNGRDYVNNNCHCVRILEEDEGQTMVIQLLNVDT